MEQGNDLQLQNASGPGVHVNVGVGTVCNKLTVKRHKIF